MASRDGIPSFRHRLWLKAVVDSATYEAGRIDARWRARLFNIISPTRP